MKNKKRMYLSFPITGRDLNQVKEYAESVKRAWVAKGYDVVTPFEVNPIEISYEECMGRCVTALMLCDGIILCSDWFSSKGCRAECSVAQVYGKFIRIDNTKYEEDQV